MTSMKNKIHVLIVDDHPIVRMGISGIVDSQSDMFVAGHAANGREAILLFEQLSPDVTLMDLRLADMSGSEVTAAIRQEFPEARIIALTSYDGDQDIYRALEAGVRGYLLKEMVHTEVVKAIRVVHAGKRFIPAEVAQQLTGFFPDVALTPREVEVLSLIARGLGNKEVGDILGTAPGTVKAHVQNILSKLGAKDRTHAVTIALRRGIIHLHSPGIASSLLNN